MLWNEKSRTSAPHFNARRSAFRLLVGSVLSETKSWTKLKKLKEKDEKTKVKYLVICLDRMRPGVSICRTSCCWENK